MPINFGSVAPGGLYYGDTPIQQVYLGSIPLLPEDSGGMLIVSDASIAGIVNLTELGDVDWVQYNTISTGTHTRKGGVTQILGDPISIKGSTMSRFSNTNRLGYTWTDGTPTKTGTSHTGYSMSGSPGVGYEFVIDASTEARRAVLFFGGWNTFVRLNATLNGETVYSSEFGSSTTYDRMITIDYQAESPGQQLVIRSVVRTSGGLHSFGGVAISEL